MLPDTLVFMSLPGRSSSQEILLLIFPLILSPSFSRCLCCTKHMVLFQLLILVTFLATFGNVDQCFVVVTDLGTKNFFFFFFFYCCIVLRQGLIKPSLATKLVMQSRITLAFWSSFFYFPSAGVRVTGLHHQARVYGVLGIEHRAWAC